MNVYVQGSSALAHYRGVGATTTVERQPKDIRSLADATSSLTKIIEAGIWRLGIGEPTADRPLEVLVRDSSQRSRSRAVKARIWKQPIALTAFRQVGNNIFVSSPEFTFLQMALRLDLPELTSLGMELCGTYRCNVEVQHLDTGESYFTTSYNQQPLTTPKRLRGFLDSMRSAPGYLRAHKALSYVLPNSASPAETALYLLLCLPRRLGGYALPKPVLNPPITLSKAGRQHTLRKSARPDLYWKEFRLDLEYNSDEFHDESNRVLDSMRRKALERMGVEVIELTKEELYSTELFHATVLRIARRFSKRIRSEGEGDFKEHRAALRKLLLVDSVDEVSRFQNKDDAEESAVYVQGYEDIVPQDDSGIWLDEFPDYEMETDDIWDDDSTWTAEVADWDEASTWTAEVADWYDEDLNVFGKSSQKEN
ncbi:MAG: hypothetical protein Q4C09_00925 [Atopobiaceae bacterium]|nr:hypothetical protein [Atopobiaceae bacterium]